VEVNREVRVTLCDNCGNDVGYANPCLRCAKVYCYECAKTKVVNYTHAVNLSGSGDGRYCLPCDTFLMDHPEPLHTAYLRIANLRSSQKRMYEEWEALSKKAEVELKALQGKSRG